MISSPTVMQRSIAFEMKRLRLEAGLTQTKAAELSGYTDGAINHLEKRNRRPQKPMIVALLKAYEREDLLQKFEDKLRLMNRPNWWANQPGSEFPTGFDIYLGLEDGASAIDWWEPLVIPGLLQTENYARRVLSPGPTQLDPDELQSRVELRQRRQQILTRSENPVQLWVVTTEFTLAHMGGPTEIKRGQLEHLLSLTRLPNVELQVIPMSVGIETTHGTRGPFTHLKFDQDDDPGVVYVETQPRAVWFEKYDDIEAYALVMNHLRALAAGTEESAAIIERHRKEVK